MGNRPRLRVVEVRAGHHLSTGCKGVTTGVPYFTGETAKVTAAVGGSQYE